MASVLKRAGLSWRYLARMAWQSAMSDNIANRAAELAFWFLLGFFPMLVAVTSMVAMTGSTPGSQDALMKYMSKLLPSTASGLVRQVLTQTTAGGKAWLSLLFALWSAASASAGLIDTLNGIYELKESRPWWKARAIALAIAVAAGIAITVALVLVVYGPVVLSSITSGSAMLLVWRVVQWPVAAFLLVLALLCVYRFSPDIRDQRWEWLLPGSIVAAVVWVVLSVLFKVYIGHFSHYGVLYGSLGTLIILMLWFYLTAVAILIGGEINSILEDAAAKRSVAGAKPRGHRSLAEAREQTTG